MTKKCVITVKDEVWCYITGLLPTEQEILFNAFAPYVDGYFFQPKYRLGQWDGRIRFYQRTGKTYIRIIDKILPYLEGWNYEIEIVDNRQHWDNPIVNGAITKTDKYGIAIDAEGLDLLGNIEIGGKKFLLRAYQLQCVLDCVAAGSGIIIAATSAGKTSITAAISHVYSLAGHRAITIVPSSDLVDQTASFYKLLQLDTGVYAGDNKDINHQHVVATWQALQYNPSVLADFRCVIWDECFSGDSPVLMADLSYRKIKDVQVGDYVMSMDQSGNFVSRQVLKTHVNLPKSNGKMLKLTLDNGKSIDVTEEHVFYLKNGQKAARNLSEDDEICQFDSAISNTRVMTFARLLKREEIEKPDKVYDLTVQENHNYIVNGVVVSNCHGIKASVAQKLLNENGKHIPFRFGVTGTFPKPDADQMSIYSSVGPILREISASWLIEHGYLATVEIEPVELNETYVDEEFPDYAAEKAFTSKSTARMEMIANIIISKCATYGNTLVLVNSIPFGEKLATLIKGAVFLYGESPKDIRKEHYSMFAERNDLIVIASSGIASTGISIDRVFCLILVDAGKSFIKAIQSIGRGLRLADDKKSVHVVDIHSKLKWSRKHWREREKYYKEANYPIAKKQFLKVKN